MKRLIFLFLFIFFLTGVFASSEINVYYFYADGCIHCANVADSGVLNRVVKLENVSLQKHNVRDIPELYNSWREKLLIPASWPLVILEQGDNLSYLMGDEPIIDDLERILSEKGFNQANEISWRDRISLYLEKKFVGNLNQDTGQLSFFGWGILIVAGLIDSINPCAIGVLIFLMISLLKMGSNRRALKAGLIYTLVVFIVYFLAGFGIFKIIQQFTGITRSIYLVAGILVLMLGLWQFKDIIFPKFGPSLQISPSAKPIIEKIIYKGTIPAMIVLGIIVSIFELPCTGGVYIAIIAILAKFQVSPILYLFVYNLVFILPLIVLTILIYKGTKPERLQRWASGERIWMKLAAGIILETLGIYILFFS